MIFKILGCFVQKKINKKITDFFFEDTY